MKKTYNMIGTMSGTSMDGIDTTYLTITTNEQGNIEKIEEKDSFPLHYDLRFHHLLKIAEMATREAKGNLELAKKNYYSVARRYLKNLDMLEISIDEKLKTFSEYLYPQNKDKPIEFDDDIKHSTELHATAIKNLLKNINEDPKNIDAVGYHGQTLFHNPIDGITIQVGDGQQLANSLDITVINDFRQNDMRHKGQGAPLAPLYHQILATIGHKKFPLAVLNCGGIANVTYITGTDPNKDIIGFDTGPGNGLIDNYVKYRTHGTETMDKNGKYGQGGDINDEILDELFKTAVQQQGKNYFDIKPPKSLDISDLKLTPELMKQLDDLSMKDACRTLEASTAKSIVRSLSFIPKEKHPQCWVLAGGGWNNPVILEELKTCLSNESTMKNAEVLTAKEAGWNSTTMEAQIFATFALLSLQGKPLTVPNTTGCDQPVSGGHAYVPHERLKNATHKVQVLLNKNPDILFGYSDENKKRMLM